MSAVAEREWVSCADTAKLVRKALKDAFPGVKFSVRSSTYSGGASISIGYTDGPPSSQVDEVTQVFRGADFDGMIDMKSYRQHWLEDDGTVSIAHVTGTEGSRGSIPEHIGSRRTAGARLVRFGADFIFSQRDLSEPVKAKITAHIERNYALGTPGNKLDMDARLENWQCSGRDLFHRIACKATVNQHGIAYAK